MNPADNVFFEAYKRLDRLCGDIFTCNSGVSEYISQMEKTVQGRYKVDPWLYDYKKLKHIRWVRNQIAHDVSDCAFSDDDDLLFAEEFYDRILNQTDPLAHMRRQVHPEGFRSASSDRHYQRNDQSDNEINSSQDKSDRRTSCFYVALFLMLVAGALIFLLR